MRILLVFVGLIFSIVLIGLAILAMAIYHVGTEINLEHTRIREYGSLFGLRRGKWKPLAPFSAIVILGKRRVSTMYSRGQVALDQVERNHDVTLVDATHRKKFLLKACDSIEEARVLAEQVATFTGFPIERYAPRRISERRR
ncbi:MAG: hypothetical protein KF905_10950 [Flavobacteriales bacterium]|nr:hypothetical protein [Flavobacteriales bacterium]